MKNYLLLGICLFILTDIQTQVPCQSFQGNPVGAEPPGCFMCERVYRGGTAGHKSDSFNFDFPCDSIENHQWISVYPDHNGVIAINFSLVSCWGNNGIQGALYDANFNIISDCFSTLNSNLEDSIHVSGLIQNQPYHVMVSAIENDLCGFYMNSSFEPEIITFDTTICPGSCFMYSDSCYFEATEIQLFPPCLANIRLNIKEADTEGFQINYLLDTFTNSISFNWNVLGADSFDIFIDDIFQVSQDFSSYLIPITPILKDSFNFRVVPRSKLGCSFKTSEINYPSGHISSKTEEQNKLQNAITISPNPSKDIFKINSKKKILGTTVFDLNGKKIMTSKSDILDLSAFDNGVYFLKIQTKTGMVVKRVLKI